MKNRALKIWQYCKDNLTPAKMWLYFKSNFSIWHVLSVQGMLKIAFLYSCAVLSIIFFDFQLPNIKYRGDNVISIYSTPRIGEGLLQDRMVMAAEKIGWHPIKVTFSEDLTTYCLTSHLYYVAANVVNFIYKPKFNVAATHYVYITPYGYNVVYLNVPNDMLFEKGDFKEKYIHLAQYDAFIDLHSVANGTNPKLLEALKKHNMTEKPVVPMYLAHHYVPYSAAKRDQMLLVGSLWGCNRGSERMKDALIKFAKEDTLVAYGLDGLEFLGDAYKGMAEEYDKNDTRANNLFNLQKNFGISLVVHSLEHMVAKIPTSRIAESIAAGAIVISDNNAFVKNAFGDSVLYFDSVTQGDEIYSQLKAHIDWIKQNPEAVEVKTKAAYDILMRDFVLENQLQKLDVILKNEGKI